MKFTIFLIGSACLSATSANASLLSAWDFTQLDAGAPTVASNWSDLTGDGVNNSNGTMYLDGNNGSSSFTFGSLAQSRVTANNVGANTTIAGRTLANQLGTDPARSFSFQTITGLGDANGGSIVFGTGGDGTPVTNVTFSYAAGLQNNATDTADIFWEVSTDGSIFSPVETDVINNTTADAQVYTLGTFTGTTNEIFYRGTFSGIDQGNPIQIDNIQITGDVIPEPSTYAILAGFAALGLAIIRRRRS